jgi:hypothetical protein
MMVANDWFFLAIVWVWTVFVSYLVGTYHGRLAAAERSTGSPAAEEK